MILVVAVLWPRKCQEVVWNCGKKELRLGEFVRVICHFFPVTTRATSFKKRTTKSLATVKPDKLKKKKRL